MQKCILAFALSFAATTAVIDSPTTWIINGKVAKDSPLVAVCKLPPATYRIIGYSETADPVTYTVAISTDVGPGPLPPIDPTPRPVDPIVVPKAGFRVLIVEQERDRATLSHGQLGVLQSTAIRDYAKAHCAKGPDGKTPEFRIIDVDSDISLLPQVWRDAMARNRTSLPWLIISDGAKGESIPLPQSEAETLAILRKYGG